MADDVLAGISVDDLVSLAVRLGETPSQCGIDPEEPCARLVADELDRGGITAELRDVAPGRPNVVAVIRGSGDGPSLALNGHLDTTPLALDWTMGHAVSVESGLICGHGLRNMKGGIAAMIAAMIAIKQSGVQLAGDLWLTAVMGHHEGGVGTSALIGEGLVPDYAILPEPTDLGIRTVQTGSATLRVHLTGRTGPAGGISLFEHFASAADYPSDVVRALPLVLEALDAVSWTHDPDPSMPDIPMLQIRGVQAGYGHHRLPVAFAPDSGVVTVGVLSVRGQTPLSLLADVERALAPVTGKQPGLRVDVELVANASGSMMRESLAVSEHARVVRALAAAYGLVTGESARVGAILPNSYFGCDAQLFAAHGCEAVSFGPGSHAYRRTNRGRVSIDDLVTCARVLTLAALEVCGAERHAEVERNGL